MKVTATVLFLFLLSGKAIAIQKVFDFSWLDADKKVYVLQNKVYPKKGTHYLNLGFVLGPRSSFRNSRGGQILYGHYFAESWAFETSYHLYSGEDNKDTENLKKIDDIVPFIRQIESKIGAMLLWSPFYGKLNIFNSIFYFDFSFGLGGGVISGKDNAKTAAFRRVKDRYDEQKYPSLMGKVASRVYIGKRYHVSLEYHWDYYSARDVQISENSDPGKIFESQSAFSINLGTSFQ